MRDLSGKTFGSYRLEEPLGRGGMGEVYRARHLRLTNRLAAVKVLPSYLASEPDFLRRFEQEANSAAALDHPNILPIWDYGEQESIPYLAMPLVTGGTLKELLEREGPLPLDRAEEYLSQIGAALDYAHGRGIIHRDVKPANIFLRDDGRPLLADFGIAKAIEARQDQGLTRAGTGVGTPEYMAPEQIEGRAEVRSDLYSLGVVLYQMLTGRVPYSGGTPYEIAYKQMYTPPPPIRELNPNLPASVERVLQRALAKAPEERYGTAREFANAFSRALDEADLPHDQRTVPLAVAPGATVVSPGTPPPGPYGPYGGATPPTTPPPAPPYYGGGTPPPPPDRPAAAPRRANRLPLILAGVLGAILLLCVGGIAALAAFNRGGDPTATVGGARLSGPAGTQAAQSTQAAAAIASANAGAAGAPATQTAIARDGSATATAFINETNATATALTRETSATATAIQRELQDGFATATAQARADAGTATAQARNELATATAGAQRDAAATQTATAQARAAATATAAAAGTATAQAQPTRTPTTAPTPRPTTAPTTAPTPRPTGGAAASPTRAATGPSPTAGASPTAAGGGGTAGSWGPALPALSGGKAYSDPGGRFSFSVPQPWTEDTDTSAEVQFDAPDTQATMNVTLETVPASVTLEQYNSAAERNIKQQLPDYQQVALDKVTINGQQAYRRIYKATVQGALIQIQQVYFVADGRAHVLTFASLPDDFAQLGPVFNQIAGTYKPGA